MIPTIKISLVICLSFLIIWIWVTKQRKYNSSASVADAYDSWTNDRLLENLWGDHVHLGYYSSGLTKTDFRRAKIDFVHKLVHWSGLNELPRGSRILDVGCGIGGSSRILASEYGFDVVGITISNQQVNRANELTPKALTCRFEVMDAMDLKFAEGSFDGVWSVEAGPHMPNKQLYADELLRVIRPGGVLAVADWNSRDFSKDPITKFEKLIMDQLLNQWAHPSFSSIRGFKGNLVNSPFFGGFIEAADWTTFTIPSWYDSVLEGFRRPGAIIRLGPLAIFKGIREIPTILLMRWAFSVGLMRFGVFRARG